ncbi:MAG: tRNA (guanosine(37)-N1)-methyltransferase TrmD [Desulfatiglandaceae bacterium]
MRFDILTIFPDMFSPCLEQGMLARGVKRGKVCVHLVNIRDFAKGVHRTTDDRPYGGGEGMVMKPGPIHRALESLERVQGKSVVVLLSPQGKRFDQSVAWEMSGWDQIVLVCGRYEGIDERIRLNNIDVELSIGDYILSGGELAAMVVMETVTRLIPGVLGGEKSNLEDSFQDHLLEYPQYTRPRVFQGTDVPQVLLSGDHEKIRLWRREQSLKRTRSRRPDLLKKAKLTGEDERLLAGW